MSYLEYLSAWASEKSFEFFFTGRNLDVVLASCSEYKLNQIVGTAMRWHLGDSE